LLQTELEDKWKQEEDKQKIDDIKAWLGL
jgi:hypothetical protein